MPYVPGGGVLTSKAPLARPLTREKWLLLPLVLSALPRHRAPAVHKVEPADLIGHAVATAGSLADEYATVGIVVPQSLTASVARAAVASLPSAGEATRDGLERAVTVVAAQNAKGLEFDAIVVAEPELIVAEKPERAAGLRLLYVALTRPTRHLVVLFSGELPGALSSHRA